MGITSTLWKWLVTLQLGLTIRRTKSVSLRCGLHSAHATGVCTLSFHFHRAVIIDREKQCRPRLYWISASSRCHMTTCGQPPLLHQAHIDSSANWRLTHSLAGTSYSKLMACNCHSGWRHRCTRIQPMRERGTLPAGTRCLMKSMPISVLRFI